MIYFLFVCRQSESASELAQAIKELEASTAALELSCDQQTSNRHSSAHSSSSGYGSTNNTPTCSQDANLAGA